MVSSTRDSRENFYAPKIPACLTPHPNPLPEGQRELVFGTVCSYPHVKAKANAPSPKVMLTSPPKAGYVGELVPHI
ncbi:hypothetical protein GCM10007901_37430 [Dyella acidisoli]|uniref:Uncharacterized protein n=1 Tax=Dyella acidisoli TaxID=1867834 RepID=A0ABQ5XWB2_9GAMM|nr:hypothetical protein GCM10007901_37430 [Dyella acidisoli]